MISFIICCFSVIFILIGIINLGINGEKIKKLLTSINDTYLEFWRAKNLIEKIFNKIIIFILLLMMGVSSYILVVKKYEEVVSVRVIGLTILVFIFSFVIMYFFFGIPSLIIIKLSEYISNIKNNKASKELTLSFICTFVYSFFLIFLKDEIVKHYYFVFFGLTINYILNLDLLINITINPFYFISDESINYDIEENKEILKNIWIGALFLLFIIIINLLLGVLMIYNINGEAYLCSVTTNEIGILDLFYYTIVTFTTIGYGDIVPNAPESKVMAIIIAFTSVICLIIFISSILSAKSNFKKKLK